MRHHKLLVTRFMIATLLAAPMTIAACASHRGEVHDTYYGDYHRWNSTELGFYSRWEGETRRPHRDFGRRSAEEQHEYFDWRHKH
jgi:hypothetical protein